MKKIYSLTLILMLFFVSIMFGHEDNDHNKKEINYITNNLKQYDKSYQRDLRNQASWKTFTDKYPSWFAIFNEENQKPHRAFGKAIAINGGSTPIEKAIWFIQNELAAFAVSIPDLELISFEESTKFYYIHFEQKHSGLSVINSHVYVKMSLSGEVMLFGLDYYPNIELSTSPSISESQAKLLAKTDLEGSVNSIEVLPNLRVLTIAQNKKADFKLVYTVVVKGTENGMPYSYESWVDAHDGKVLYRANQVLSLTPDPIKLQLNGNIFQLNQNGPVLTQGMPNIRAKYGNGLFAFANSNGLLEVPVNAGDTITLELAGRWCNIRHTEAGVLLPSVPFVLNGDTTINWNQLPNSPLNPSTIRHTNAYYHTNLIHDTMKHYLPTFGGLDVSLATLIDRTDGSCNAFYDGASINFYITQNGCSALSQVADVVYHEYGHGITNRYYSSRSRQFQNGAMGEGYSDIFAILITGNPVLGEGFFANSPGSIRRYDNVTKRYPDNILGQVHNDGEIICGAWWKTSQAIGNLSYTQFLVYESMKGLPMAPNGQEGQLYTDILIEAITSDDDDNDLTNGTPNGAAIVNSFNQHGINLFLDADIFHTPSVNWPSQTPITISCDAVVPSFKSLAFFKNARMYYKINNATAYNDTAMVLTDPLFSTYSVDLPAQPMGTIISYYFAMEDVFGNLFNVTPRGANQTGARTVLPQILTVGYVPIVTETFEQANPNWQTGLPTDNAIEGQWIIDVPISSLSPQGEVVQTGFQNTPGGTKCAITANASSPTDEQNTADVDNGRTTLVSPTYDLSGINNPAISYYRWFTNNTGLGPNRDNWTVLISNNGTNWVIVERTAESDRAWRRNVIRVSDYVIPTATVTLQFIAEDVAAPSTVEAALDDFTILEATNNVGIASVSRIDNQVIVYPNPANDILNITFETQKTGTALILVTDILGKTVIEKSLGKIPDGKHRFELNTNALADGSYFLRLHTSDGIGVKHLIIQK